MHPESNNNTYQDECLANAKKNIEKLEKDHPQDLLKIEKSLSDYISKKWWVTPKALKMLTVESLRENSIAALKKSTTVVPTERMQWGEKISWVVMIWDIMNDTWLLSLIGTYHKVAKANKKEMWELSETTTEELTKCLTEVKDIDKSE